MYRKEIIFDRETRDFAMYLDGELVGFARTYHEAEVTFDQLVFELMIHGATATASALDGDSDADECAAEVVGMLVEVAQTETAHTNAPDCPCDECMRGCYAYLNTLAPVVVNPEALVIRADEPVQQAAVLAHREAVICATCGDCPDCDTLGETYECDGPDCIQVATHRISGFGNSHNNGSWCCYHYSELLGPCDCTDDDYGDALAESVQGTYNGAVPAAIDATALLEEADAVVGRLYCPHCLGNHLAQDCPLKHGDHAVAAYITRLAIDAGVLCSYCGERHADTACPQKRPLLAPRVCGNCHGQHSIQQCPEMREKLFA